MAARLLGRGRECADLLARGHQRLLAAEDTRGAARCAVWLAFELLDQGERAQAGGWLARARRLLDDAGAECVERGYLLMPGGIGAMHEGRTRDALAMFVEAAAIGRRFGDHDLVTLALNGQGRALIRTGETARGVALLDEAMIAVTAGEISPPIAGGIYCSVIEACHEILDLRRAREWTAALDQWCASQTDLAAYQGHCLLHRAEILQMRGAWPDALEQAERARERLSQPAPRAPVGAAFYRMAELRRLRGEFALAEETYREAAAWQREPRPGLARLRLAQGQTDVAYSAIRRVADEVREPANRTAVLDAFVEIALAAGDAAAAQSAADELATIAARLDAPWPRALSDQASGAVSLARGEAREALAALRRAWSAWSDLDAPYEAARVRVLTALACRALGDEDAARIELEAAGEAFRRLGAEPDRLRVEALVHPTPPRPAGPLTAREVEVLRRVAAGLTNKEIAARLEISEKTVARHLSNIFIKLDLTTRSAATAYAYRQGLV